MAEQRKMQKMDIVDIGGGFSTSKTNYSNQENNFDIVAPQIANYLNNTWPGKSPSNKHI